MRCDAIRNFNDGIAAYESIFHSAGYHPRPLNGNPSAREIEERVQRIEETKQKVHNPQRVQKLNRLKNYLMEANYELNL
jgi:hypothetical protein